MVLVIPDLLLVADEIGRELEESLVREEMLQGAVLKSVACPVSPTMRD